MNLLQMAQVNRSTIHHREYISFILINVRIKDLKNILFLNLTMIRPCEIHWQLIRVEKNICIIYICVCAFSISGHSCSDFKKSWKPFDRHRPAEIKYEAELSFGNVCHTLLIVVFKMNNRNPKLGQFPDLFLHNAAERRNYQNTSIGVCTITSQSI